jgi:hypothetical protein
MAYSDSTQQYQRMLASYTRTGEQTNIPGTKEEGITRYRKMIYNVVYDSISTAYPLTKKLLHKTEWDTCIQKFFSSHACQSPFLWKMPFEFYGYVKEAEHELQHAYPFLSDLLLFEWVEIEVFMMEDTAISFKREGSIKSDSLVLNPATILQYFQYPVYTKKADELTSEDIENYFLLTYRNPNTHVVAYLEVSPMLARMIEYLDQEIQSIDVLIKRFSTETNQQLNNEVKNNISIFFENCLNKGIILGYKN